MKVFLFGIIFLGYFQLFALECPYGNKIELLVSCSPGSKTLSFISFSGTFKLNTEASRNLTAEGSNVLGVMCVYKPTQYEGHYSHNEESIVVRNQNDITKLFYRMVSEDVEFPSWYQEDFLIPEFRYIDLENLQQKVAPQKNNLKIGLGMTFSGRIALENETAAHRMAISTGLNPEESLYVLAKDCEAQLITEDQSTINFSF